MNTLFASLLIILVTIGFLVLYIFLFVGLQLLKGIIDQLFAIRTQFFYLNNPEKKPKDAKVSDPL